DPRFVRPRDAGGYGLDAAWADEWHHALHAALCGDTSGYYEDFGPLALLAKALRQAWVYDGSWSPHRQRRHGRPPTGLAGHRFVISAQNHDQVGNRAAGERLAALTTPGRLRIAAALLLTSPFAPMLFQGEEWAASTPFQYFTDHEDPALGRAVSEGRRREFRAFGWDPRAVPDPQDPGTFEASKLDWDELAKAPHDGMLAWYRELLALRRRLPALGDPRLDRVRVTYDETARWIDVQRGPVRVATNLAAGARLLEVARGARLLAASDPGVRLEGGALRLSPDSVAIVEEAAPVHPTSRTTRTE